MCWVSVSPEVPPSAGAMRDDKLEDLRKHGRTGRPLGSPAFLEPLERLVGRVFRRQQPARSPRRIRREDRNAQIAYCVPGTPGTRPRNRGTPSTQRRGGQFRRQSGSFATTNEWVASLATRILGIGLEKRLRRVLRPQKPDPKRLPARQLCIVSAEFFNVRKTVPSPLPPLCCLSYPNPKRTSYG
jgi:hypothetical protein